MIEKVYREGDSSSRESANERESVEKEGERQESERERRERERERREAFVIILIFGGKMKFECYLSTAAQGISLIECTPFWIVARESCDGRYSIEVS